MANRKPSRTEWRLIKGKWTRSLGNRGARVRLFQKRSGGQFYRSVWSPRAGTFDRRCLGTADRVEAEKMGRDLLAGLLRDEAITASGALPLEFLWHRYSDEFPLLQSNAGARKDAESRIRILIGHLGAECDVRGLTENDQQAFVQKRLAGGISYTVGLEVRKTPAVRARSARADMELFQSMLKWATNKRVNDGQRLLDVNPLQSVKLPRRDSDPRRPVAGADRFQATMKAIREAGETVKPAERSKWLELELALTLAEATGRRLGSIRQLRWEDVDLTNRKIRWRAETDKKGREWTVKIPEELAAELRTFRVRLGGAFSGLLFPSDTNREVPVRRDVLDRWLRAAEEKAKLPKLDGSLWHAYRRSWATDRKDLPLKDVAAAGGWSDVGTLLRCYQQADDETIEFVMNHRRKVAK
ncbi:MAG: site-specific integrase [Gemmatimonadaceae bacterium]|nr:site-specific integrase [Gemmatimonadaceae bacterium]